MKKIIISVVFLFVVIIPALISYSKVSAYVDAYKVDEGVVYHNNNPVILKGVSWFGFESQYSFAPGGLWKRDYKEMIAQMKQLGFNSVRVPICPGTLRMNNVTGITFENGKNADLQNLKSIQVLDKIVSELNNQQMYILLDHHRIDCLTIPELWYSDSYSETQWIEDLQFMATRYKETEYFLGIDIKNEPHGKATWGTGNLQTDWNKAAENASEQILAVNNNILIFVQGIQANPSCSSNEGYWWGANFEPINCAPLSAQKIPSEKLVLSPHVYGPDVYMQPYFNDSNFPHNMPAIWQAHFGYLADKGYTVVPGEWGGRYGNNGHPKDVVFQDNIINFFIDKKICNSFYWDWNPDSGDTGGILQDDWTTPWDNKVTMLNNYYSRCQQKYTGSQNQINLSQNKAETDNIIPAGVGSKIQVVAAGSPAQNQYPSLDLVIDGSTVTTFANINGDVITRKLNTYSYNHNGKIGSNAKIELKYANDGAYNGQDRNVLVDKIIVDGVNYETEAKTVYSLGAWGSDNSCNAGYKQNELLACNGYFAYSLDNQQTEPSVKPTPNVSQFMVQYFNNIDLSGNPIITEMKDDVTENWNNNAPHPSVSNDNFSLRATKIINSEDALYRFGITADDGAKVFIDGELIIDQWAKNSYAPTFVDKKLSAGQHDLWVEYFDSSGDATLIFEYEKTTQQPIKQASLANSISQDTITPPVSTLRPTQEQNSFKAEYFDNLNLEGEPVLTREDKEINFNWQHNSPDEFIPQDKFSARWTKAQKFEDGMYRITTTTDDGVKLYIDDKLVINNWNDQAASTKTVILPFTSGVHTIVMEYYENSGGAVAQLNVEKVQNQLTAGSVIRIYAAGTQSNNIYPSIALVINGERVAQYENIKGNPTQRQFDLKEYRIPSNIQYKDIQIEYLNDGISQNGDRNLMIDKITINDQTYETESMHVYSIGSWSSSGACNGGYKQSEWLHCPGYFKF